MLINDSTCDPRRPWRPYSEKTPHAAAPRKAVAAGSFRVSAGGAPLVAMPQPPCYLVKNPGPHNRLLRRQHCSSLCSQSEGHEHVANMTSAQGGMTLLDFQLVLGRRNIPSPHFASKVSYSASPQGFVKCPRGVPCSDIVLAMLFGSKPRRDFSGF